MRFNNTSNLFRALFALLLSGVLIAQASAKTLTIREKVFDRLEKAGTHIEAAEHTKAKEQIDQASKIGNLNNYERAQIASFLGFYHYDLKQYDQAIDEYLKAVKSPKGLPDGFYNQTLYTLAQLYFEQEDFKNALRYAQNWFFSVDEPSAEAYLLIGQAHYMLKGYDKALKNIRKGVDIYVDAGRKPKENWLLLLQGIYYEKNDYKNMAKLVTELISYYPKKQYMLTLAGVYGELKQESKMLGVYEALYDSGYLKGDTKQLETLASLYLLQEIPIKAAKVLDKELTNGSIEVSENNLSLLAQAYTTAKEYRQALEPLTQLAKMTNDAKDYINLGQSYMALGNWAQAEQSFSQALDKNSLENKGNVWVNIGLARIEQKKFMQAKDAFESAKGNKGIEKVAGQWIKFVDSEIRRSELLNLPVVAVDTSPLNQS